MSLKLRKKSLDGIIVIDKPYGLSSNQILQRVKKIFNAKKAGHTGNLDPMATGVLPICFGQATKISQYLLEADKVYQAVIQLGTSTDSGDIEGNITHEHAVPTFTTTHILNVLQQFKGKSSQIPPMYSALKFQGTPLYKLARQGIEIERKPRSIFIHELQLIQYDPILHTIAIKIRCSKGTYIRTLGIDIAQSLNCAGHLIKLTRMQCGLLTDSDSISINSLEHSCDNVSNHKKILSMEYAFTDTPIIKIEDKKIKLFYQQGKIDLINNFTGIARIYDKDCFIAIASFKQGHLIKKTFYKKLGE